MRERQRNTLPTPVHLEPGDLLICTVTDRKTKTAHQFREEIGRRITVDTVVTFDVEEPVLGLSEGIGAIFGKAVPDV
jgi:hypothetical protein